MKKIIALIFLFSHYAAFAATYANQFVTNRNPGNTVAITITNQGNQIGGVTSNSLGISKINPGQIFPAITGSNYFTTNFTYNVAATNIITTNMFVKDTIYTNSTSSNLTVRVSVLLVGTGGGACVARLEIDQACDGTFETVETTGVEAASTSSNYGVLSGDVLPGGCYRFIDANAGSPFVFVTLTAQRVYSGIGAVTGSSGEGSGTTPAEVAAQISTNGPTVLFARNFGAVGDGVTDDTVALQAAITAANVQTNSAIGYSIGRTELQIEAGLYRTTAPLWIRGQNGLKIVGLGGPGQCTISNSTTTLLISTNSATGVEPNYNEICGLTFKGANLTTVGILFTATINTTDEMNVHDCLFQGFNKAIYAIGDGSLGGLANSRFVNLDVFGNLFGIVATNGLFFANQVEGVFVANSGASFVIPSGIWDITLRDTGGTLASVPTTNILWVTGAPKITLRGGNSEYYGVSNSAAILCTGGGGYDLLLDSVSLRDFNGGQAWSVDLEDSAASVSHVHFTSFGSTTLGRTNLIAGALNTPVMVKITHSDTQRVTAEGGNRVVGGFFSSGTFYTNLLIQQDPIVITDNSANIIGAGANFWGFKEWIITNGVPKLFMSVSGGLRRMDFGDGPIGAALLAGSNYMTGPFNRSGDITATTPETLARFLSGNYSTGARPQILFRTRDFQSGSTDLSGIGGRYVSPGGSGYGGMLIGLVNSDATPDTLIEAFSADFNKDFRVGRNLEVTNDILARGTFTGNGSGLTNLVGALTTVAGPLVTTNPATGQLQPSYNFGAGTNLNASNLAIGTVANQFMPLNLTNATVWATNNGSASAPSLRVGLLSNSGIFGAGVSSMGFTVSGNLQATLFSDATFNLGAGGSFGWSGRSGFFSPSDGRIDFKNNAGTAGATITFGTGIATNGVASYANDIPVAVTIGASPFNFTNTTPSNLECYFSGATAYAVDKNGVNIYGSLAGDCYLMLKPGKRALVTYTVAPTFLTNSW